MLRFVNEANGRCTDYSREYLAREARHAIKHLPDSDGKVLAWYVRIVEPSGRASLCIDYLTGKGEPKTHHIAI